MPYTGATDCPYIEEMLNQVQIQYTVHYSILTRETKAYFVDSSSVGPCQ